MATTITANGINFPDGSASSPSIGGSDTNTGLFTGADLIGFSTGGSERIRIDSSGNIQIPADTKFLQIGASQDLDLHHNGTDSYIRNKTGNLHIRPLVAEEGIILKPNAAVELYCDNSKKFNTVGSGVQVTGSEFISEGTIYLQKSGAHHHRILSNDSGNDLAFQQSSSTGADDNFTTYLRINDGGNISLPVDNQKLRLGASQDLELFHNGSNSYIQDNGTGALLIGSNGGGVFIRGQHGEESIIANSNGSVDLYHDNSKKFFTSAVGINSATHLPDTDNAHDLGASYARWDDVFATNGTIQTSDRNSKKDIVKSDLGLTFINAIEPVSYKFKTGSRTHYGVIAQDLETVLDGKDFAGLTKDTSTGNYGVRYTELIAPLIKAVQELTAKVEALEAG